MTGIKSAVYNKEKLNCDKKRDKLKWRQPKNEIKRIEQKRTIKR